jgi:hypothetical protein
MAKLRRITTDCFRRRDSRQIFASFTEFVAINMVDSAFVAIVLASHPGRSSWPIFRVLNVGLTAVRTVGWARYQRRQKADANTSKWALCATLGSGLSGLLWGVSSPFLLADNLVEQTFIAFGIGGICAASLISFS